MRAIFDLVCTTSIGSADVPSLLFARNGLPPYPCKQREARCAGDHREFYQVNVLRPAQPIVSVAPAAPDTENSH